MDQILNFDYFSLLLEFVLTCKIRVLLKKKIESSNGRIRKENIGESKAVLWEKSIGEEKGSF